jgi:hypothetical protein
MTPRQLAWSGFVGPPGQALPPSLSRPPPVVGRGTARYGDERWLSVRVGAGCGAYPREEGMRSSDRMPAGNVLLVHADCGRCRVVLLQLLRHSRPPTRQQDEDYSGWTGGTAGRARTRPGRRKSAPTGCGRGCVGAAAALARHMR